MLKAPLFLGWLLCCAAAHAQSLQDQINAVAAVQDREETRRIEWFREQAAREERAAAQQRALQVARERALAAAAKSARDEALADKRRDQQYKDRLRELEL